MANLSASTILQEEEKVLLTITGKLNDQLNRLKVEELALLSQIRAEANEGQPQNSEQCKVERMSHEREGESEDRNEVMDTEEPLDLGIQLTNQMADQFVVEEEEEEDSEEEDDSPGAVEDELMSFMKKLQQQTL